MTTVQPLGPFLYEFKDGVAKHPLAVMNFMPALPNLAAWYDSLDPITMLAGDGNIVTDGGTVALWKDKSGNSGVNCLVLPGVAGNYGAAPDENALDIVGDLGLWCVAALNDITPATQAALVAKFNTVGDQRSYYLGIATTGVPFLVWSTTGAGAGNISVSCSENISAIASDYSKFGLGATLDVDNGAGGYVVTFYKSTDGGVTWSTFGNATTGGSTTSVYSGSAGLTIGAQSTGAADQLNGRVYRAFVRNSTATSGATVLDIDFTAAPTKLANGDTFVCTTGQTVTLNSSGATGARIAGERDLFQGTAANRPVWLQFAGTKYGYLNGTAGNYFSTPDSAAADLTDNLDLWASLSLADWSPSANQHVISKFTTTGDQRSYRFAVAGDVLGTGKLVLTISTGGTSGTSTNYVSTAAVAFADGANGWVRVTRTKSSGDINFYTSANGTAWTKLGDTVAGTTSAIYVSTAVVEVGTISVGATEPTTGRVHYAAISGTIPANPLTTTATPVVSFNPALYTSGTTFTASTGEVWTVNGGAHIVTRTGLYFDGSDDYLKTAAFSLSQPETVYWTGEQTTTAADDTLWDGGADSTMRVYQSAVVSGRIVAYSGGAPVLTREDLPLKTTATIETVYNAGSSSLNIDRRAATSGALTAATPNGVTLAARGGVSAYANIFVSEVAIYSAAHPTATQDRMALYEGRKHGFAV